MTIPTHHAGAIQMNDQQKEPPSTFKEFRAALARFNDANTVVSIADRTMILSNASFLLDEYERAASAPTVPVNAPTACEAFKWPPLPALPNQFFYGFDHYLFTQHQMQGYANAYGEILRAALQATPAAEKNEPRNVEGMTRAEFERHLRLVLQHDNVRRKERGIPEMTADAMKAEIAERVERNYPASAFDYAAKACPGCSAFDGDLLEVEFVQGCEGCEARMQKIAGFGPMSGKSADAAAPGMAEPIGFRTRVPGFAWTSWITDDQNTIKKQVKDARDHGFECEPLYAATPPAQTQRALTDEQRKAIILAMSFMPYDAKGRTDAHKVLDSLLVAHPTTADASTGEAG
ncbi:hypothetical protein NDK50_08270 [Paraburkholderia bryophila]|uniref:hypothetical protein n=1 Tax=Paraburkholderia bryophila TaxID=420952 RepID=UPI00234BC896|nr:hypothetical protein [Paraburkholderia bryophila]WCM21432.1 hypothetical protein NDK50_08270 [Paraburkholderia bryophila]